MKAIYSLFFMMLAFGITMQAQLVTPQPSPAAEIYPPTNIKEYNTIIVANARYWIAKIILR